MKRFRLLPLPGLMLALVVCPLSAQTQSAPASGDFLPPEGLIVAALAGQPEVRAAAARLAAARAEQRALAVGSYETEATLIPQRRDTDADGRYREWEAQLTRSIRLPGKARLDRQIGAHGQRAADLRLDDAEHQAARRLLQRWMDWLRTSVVMRTAEARLALVEREHAALARRVQLGDAAALELDLLEAEQARLQAEALSARAAAIAAHASLVSEFPQIPLPERLPVLPDPQPLPGGPARWRELIVARSHEIGIAEEEAARQEQVAERVRAERRPDPSIGLRLLEERGGQERALGVVVSVPLGVAYRGALARRESANADARVAEAAGVRRLIEQEAQATVRDADDRWRQWQATQAALQAQQDVAAKLRRAWELGEVALADWLLAARNEAQAAQAEAVARADALEAGLRVRVDSHELWHPQLEEGHVHLGGQ